MLFSLAVGIQLVGPMVCPMKHGGKLRMKGRSPFCNPELMELKCNNTVTHFILKKSKPEDIVEVVRPADELRTIGCNNTDNKICAGNSYLHMRKPVA